MFLWYSDLWTSFQAYSRHWTRPLVGGGGGGGGVVYARNYSLKATDGEFGVTVGIGGKNGNNGGTNTNTDIDHGANGQNSAFGSVLGKLFWLFFLFALVASNEKVNQYTYLLCPYFQLLSVEGAVVAIPVALDLEIQEVHSYNYHYGCTKKKIGIIYVL